MFPAFASLEGVYLSVGELAPLFFTEPVPELAVLLFFVPVDLVGVERLVVVLRERVDELVRVDFAAAILLS